jgi:uncharacterized protein (TIGR00725 family)
MKKIIGVLGGKSGNSSKDALLFAEAVGREIAKRGFALVSGGYDGIMEAASRGCKDAGGVTIGILKHKDAEGVNPYIDYAVPTSMGTARNNIIILTASGLIAFEGGYGTASEIVLALDAGRPIIVTGDKSLLRPEALKADNCLYIKGNDPKNAGEVLDKLCGLMDRVG